MHLRLLFLLLLGIASSIASEVWAIDGVKCTNTSSYYCASYCSQCSSLGGFSCTGEKCKLPKGSKSGELHWHPRPKS
jgi:hypothetical protein